MCERLDDAAELIRAAYRGAVIPTLRGFVDPLDGDRAYEIQALNTRAWQAQIVGATNVGHLVTAGDLVFQGLGTGDFYAFDARSGKQLFQQKAPSGIRASPLTYSAAGRQSARSRRL